MKPVFVFACAVMAILPAARALAQDAFVLDEIVISGNLTETPASRTGATVETLSQDAIEATGKPDLAGLIDTLPGVSLTANGGPGAVTTVRVRGLPTRYAPVFLDGIDITDPSGTQQDLNFGSFTTLGLGRVELSKGSQSSLFGSEAVAGVINLTTARPEEEGTQVSIAIEAGSYDTFSTTFGLQQKTDRTELSLTLSRFETDGFSAADENDGATEADGHSSSTLLLSGAYDLSGTVRLGLSGFIIDTETDQDGFGPTDGPGTEFALRKGVRLFAEIEGETIDHEVSISASRTDRDYPTGFTNAFAGERREVRYLGETSIGAKSGLAFGAQFSREDFSADANSGTYDIASIFGEVTTAVTDDLDLALSLRADDHSEFGSEVTGRIAAAYRPREGTILRASAGTGFRAPSLFELFSPCCGNVALQPETSQSVDLGIEQQLGAATLKATVFYVEIDDLIDFGAASYVQVPGTTTSQGLELGLDYAFANGLIGFANYTLTDAENDDGEALFRVPEHDLTLGLRGNVTDRLSGSVTVQHVADLIDTDGGFPASAIDLPDYTVVNLSAAYELRDGIELFGRIDNVLDEEYQTTRGYGTSDRAAYVGLRATF